MPPDPSFNQFTNRELEALVHVLIYRVDLLLSCLALCDWGDQDFSRTVEETEAILHEGTMYEVGRRMDRTVRALEGVADAASMMARYSMLAPGYAETSTRLEEALKALQEAQGQSPVSIHPDPE